MAPISPIRLAARLLLLVLVLAPCHGAPRVEIRIVPRPQPESEAPSAPLGPFPIRPPQDPSGGEPTIADVGMQMWAKSDETQILVLLREQDHSPPMCIRWAACATSAGLSMDTGACVGSSEVNRLYAHFDGNINNPPQCPFSVLLDVCHLKNVTFIDHIPETPATTEATASTSESPDSGRASEESISSADADDTEVVEPESPPPPMRKLLGIYRGWKMDPITKKYKHAVFDDGDYCGDHGERYSVEIELVQNADPNAHPTLYDFRQISPCAYAARVDAYIADFELDCSAGIKSPGVIEISDASETLPQVCGEMKCQYGELSSQVDLVRQELAKVKETLSELITSSSTSITSLSLSSATAIIKSSTDVMESALSLIQTLEAMQNGVAERPDDEVHAQSDDAAAITATS